MSSDATEVPERLARHLATWLGQWPPAVPLQVVGSPQRARPGWDGQVHPALGVGDPARGAVLSVPPSAEDSVRRAAGAGHLDGADALPSVLARLPHLLGVPGRRTYQASFRWTTRPAPLPDVGEWVDAGQDSVPGWLRPFGGTVLVATDQGGQHLAGVGIKRHNPDGHELSVVTAPAARGRGLARALVAQAARRVLDEGAVPTYQHSLSNAASARVAEAAGFTDQGWTSFGVSEATAAPALTVYGTGWCPDVRRSRAVLDAAGVAYAYVDLERDPAATRLVQQLQGGRRRIPTLVWPDGHHLVEPTDDALRARLAAARPATSNTFIEPGRSDR